MPLLALSLEPITSESSEGGGRTVSTEHSAKWKFAFATSMVKFLKAV
jgi:hypothetical protein